MGNSDNPCKHGEFIASIGLPDTNSRPNRVPTDVVWSTMLQDWVDGSGMLGISQPKGSIFYMSRAKNSDQP